MDLPSIIDILSKFEREPAFFQTKATAIIPDVIKALQDQRVEIQSLDRSLAIRNTTIDNLESRLRAVQVELRQVKEQLEEQRPKVTKLQGVINAARTALQNGDV